MKTKKMLALTALVLLAAMLLPLTSLAEVTEGTDGAAEAPIIGNLSKAYDELGLVMGEASNHGNNQTRIAYTSSGVYVSCPTDDFDAAFDPYGNREMYGSHYVLYVVKPDGSKKILIQDDLFITAAGTTTNLMVDKNEDIWVVTSWDEAGGLYPLIAWHYDVSEDTATKYDMRGFYEFGGNYGKPVAIMDAVNNKIYVVVFCYQKCPGRVAWATFDIETKTWEKVMHTAKAPCGCCYQFGYADGKGGFFFVTTRTLDNINTPSNIEGLTVNAAMMQFKNRSAIDVGQVWDETYLYYVPDAGANKIYSYSFGDAFYDVEAGIYPCIINRSSDVYLDESTGLFYVLREEQDCNGGVGLHMMLYIFDTKGREGDMADGNIFPMICKKEIAFSYGVGVNYFPHVVEDLEGNLYIVVATERSGELEIWAATDEIGSEYEFVFTGAIDEHYDDHDYSQWRSLIVANNRNNSMASDTVYFLYEGGHKWESFSVDFAALRAKMAK